MWYAKCEAHKVDRACAEGHYLGMRVSLNKRDIVKDAKSDLQRNLYQLRQRICTKHT